MLHLPKILVSKRIILKISMIVFSVFIVSVIFLGMYRIYSLSQSLINEQKQKADLQVQFADKAKQLQDVINEDQYLKNKKLEENITNIEKTYKKAISTYEKILDFQGSTKKNIYTQLFAKVLTQLSERNYVSASATLADTEKQIADEQAKIAASFVIPENVIVQNVPPSSGFSRQKVQTDIGDFLVDIVTADLNSTKVIVDTASDSDCKDNCPVLSLADYVSRSGAYAGINGSYFCPSDYPSCSGKKNSFDTLAMNKNKKYLNSENNVYSTVPAVIFTGNSARFVGASQEWGRDTGVDSVLANQPLLLSSGNVVFGGNSDPKQGSRGARSFVGASGSNAYIGVVYSATVAEVARVLQKMGMQFALNLDSGGSTALWSGGYKVGPGRNIPNALLFVRK